MKSRRPSSLIFSRFMSPAMLVSFQRWVALSAPYAMSSVLIVLLPLELIQRGLLPWAAASAAAWAFFQGVGSLMARSMIRKVGSVDGVRMFVILMVAVAGVTVVAVGFLNTVGAGLVLFAASSFCGVVWSVFHVVNRSVVAQWGEVWVRRVGPAGRVSAAVGAVAATAVVVSPVPVWVGVVFVFGMFGSVVFTRKFNGLPSAQLAGRWSYRVVLNNALFALAGYGVLTLYVPLVSLTAGPAWVGVSMGAYALGTVFAPMVARRVKLARSDSSHVWTVLSALTVPVWVFAGWVPYGEWLAVVVVLIIRLVSGVVLFAVEGSADVAAASTGTFAAALSGRNIAGAFVGVVVGGVIASGVGFWGAYVVLMAVAVTAVVFSFMSVRRST